MNFLQNIKFDFIDFLPFADRPCRAKLIPSKVWDDLDAFKNDSDGLVNYCKKWRTTIKFLKNKSKSKMSQKYVAIGGEYYERQNIILIYTRDSHFNTFAFTEESWDRFKYKFIQTLMHEFIHFMQYDRRYEEPSYCYYPYKRTNSRAKNEDRKYHSNFDEVQAYAHCVYLDIKNRFPNKDIHDLISSCQKRSPSSTLSMILKTFDYDTRNNEVFDKLYREIIRWHNRYEKQFKTA
jgi:hypothetical protein